MQHDELQIAEGFSFGTDGRYALLKPLGSPGWEGQVYAVVDQEIETNKNIKAAKFSLIDTSDFSVAPTWSSKQINISRNNISFNKDICQDLVWFECSGDRSKYKNALSEIKLQFKIHKKHKKTLSKIGLIPIIDEFGITIIPYRGNLSVCLYQIMSYFSGKAIPKALSDFMAPTQYRNIAERMLNTIVIGLSEYYLHGMVLGAKIDDVDIHPNNIIFDGDNFRLIDVRLSEKRKQDIFEESVKQATRLALQVLHWDMIGMSLVAHVEGKIYLDWLEEIDQLKTLPRKLSEECIAKTISILGKTNTNAIDYFRNLAL